MTKQNFTTIPVAPLPVPTACGNCGVEERCFLHHVRHRGIFRRLCTNCVLRLNTQSFCPTCLLVYDPSPPPSSSSNGLVSCQKCYSLSHNSCVGLNPPHPYVCPLCVNPNSPVFTLKKGNDVVGVVNEDAMVIDKQAARVLLTAARIAAGTMNKAAVAAKVEAERRAKDAAFTRKRAREALDHVAYLDARDKMKKKDVVLRLPSNVNNRGSSNNNQCLSMVVAAVPLEEVNNVLNANAADRLDGSSEVLVALNAVDLKGQNPVPGLPNGSAMDVEMNRGAMVTPTISAINHSAATGAEEDKSGELDCSNGQREMVNVTEQDQDQHMVNPNAGNRMVVSRVNNL
ncbi:uncharacterized protein LOC107829290 [Nicotiana tabacum]|uniref:Uncharacterized protein LOC107829290 n=1 Tax=Nicotiana tabacum TaxID=4097 RepID=A0A1S4DFY5_TOBAC|nr:PREDICTED: uncharacterized protein LOC107829290 [Nicotiana tabacum]